MAEVLELVNAVKPKHTLVYGKNADAVAHWLRRKHLTAQVFQASQNETLF
jgi:hypothetical protein